MVNIKSGHGLQMKYYILIKLHLLSHVMKREDNFFCSVLQ